jgi:cbb3-type cytochrome oxidase subunit 3
MSRPSLEGVDYSHETDVEAARFVAIFVAIFFPLFVAIVLAFSTEWRAAEDRARARRMAEHRMNARLLRLKI